MLMKILCVFIAAACAWFFWILRATFAERGRATLESWSFNFAISSAIIAAFLTIEVFTRDTPASVARVFSAIFLFGLFVNLARNVYHAVQQKLGFASSDANHIRGAALIDEKKAARALRGQQSRFSVGEVPVPVELETRGFLIAGAPGTGKSQTLTHALDALRNDDQRAVIADASGIYCSRYFDAQRDAIINPFDSRSAAWSPLAEIESVADIPALTKSLVPDAEGAAAEWSNYAQTFVEAILEHCFTAGLLNSELFRLIAIADIAELREICAGTPAAPLVADGNERMFGSVRSIAASACRFIQYLDPAAGADGFSIRKWIQSEAAGYLFLTYQQQHRDAQKSQIAACVDIAARAVLSLPPSHDRRVVFALDELPLLGRVQSIVDLATNGRKHGAMIFAGLQSISQLRETYGNNTAQTLLSCLGSWLVLRVPDAETAEYMSRYIGEEEKTRIVSSGGKTSQSMQLGSSSSENWQEQIVKDRVVLPSELQQLPDLRGIFNLAGPTPAAVVTLKIASERKVADAFVAAPPRVREKPQQKQQQQQQNDKDNNATFAADLI